MNINKMIKQFIFSFVAVLAFGTICLTGTESFAETTTVTKTEQHTPIVESVGSDLSLSYVTNLKINGKSIKKMKKKVKTITTDTYQEGFYFPASYYTSEDAYGSYEKYKQAKDNYKYKPAYSYSLNFLKEGTYTITYDKYSYDTSSVNVPGKSYNRRDVTITKTTHTRKIKVLKSTTAITSIKLGKSTWSSKTSNSASSSSRKSVVNHYLTGTSGKLSVKANKNYAITSIIVVTYNGEGDPVYTSVKNNQTISYGQFVMNDSYTSSTNSIYNRINKSMYKPTKVYVSYRNKFTGAYTTYFVKTRSDGSTYVEYESKDADDIAITKGTGLYGSCHSSFVFYKK